MCQGCYSSWSFVNEQCPLDSLDLAELAHTHQSRVWPCIPDAVWINELWTSNSRITPPSHQTQLGEIYSLQKCRKNQHQPCHASQFEHHDQDRTMIFQKPPIIWCVGEHNELGHMPNSILYQTNKTFDRTCLPLQTVHAVQQQTLLIVSVDWFLLPNLANNVQKAQVFRALFNGHTQRWGEKPQSHSYIWEAGTRECLAFCHTFCLKNNDLVITIIIFLPANTLNISA